MIRAFIFAALLVGTLALGCGATIFITHHPFLSSFDLGEDTADAKASFRACSLYASWPVELKRGEHLTLERRICPVGFHKKEEDEGWPFKLQHEVLLLESKHWWRTQIISAQFSDLDFTIVEVGKTSEGRDAVLWSYFIKCGSCHGGPNGVLAWSTTSSAYLWNENWFDSSSKLVEAKLPEDNFADSPASLTWENHKTQLAFDEAVYGPKDANCCPTAGRISADFIIKDGHINLDGSLTYSPSR
jgi:hypothetical protein